MKSSIKCLSVLVGISLVVGVGCKPRADDVVPLTEGGVSVAERKEEWGAGGRFLSGLGQEGTFDELSEEERAQFLDNAYEYMLESSFAEQLTAMILTHSAMMEAMSHEPENDEELRKYCVGARDKLEPMPQVRQDPEIPEECSVTVGEAEKCVEGIIAHGDEITKGFLTCETITLARLEGGYMLESVMALNELPAGCEAQAEKCGGFLSSSTEEETSLEEE